MSGQPRMMFPWLHLGGKYLEDWKFNWSSVTARTVRGLMAALPPGLVRLVAQRVAVVVARR